MTVLERFSEPQIDLADAYLVWLAEMERSHLVLTTDRRDFDILCTGEGRAFERIWVCPEYLISA